VAPNHQIDMAHAVGQSSDEQMYRTQLASFLQEFNTAFYNSTSKKYADGGQTAQSLALWLGAVPSADLTTVVNNLANDVMVTHNEHLTTGIIGAKYLLEALSLYGRTDVALAIAAQTSYPSWGYMIHPTTTETPATTIWELWDSDNEGDGMNSRNHIMFGTVSSWFHRSLGGVWPGSDNEGFANIEFKPEIFQEIKVNYVDDTISNYRGQVRSSWMLSGGPLCGDVPENANLVLTCPDTKGVIGSVIFASFGTPSGTCPNFTTSSCNAANSTDIITKACVGQHTCTVAATDTEFGDPCYGTVKVLAAVVACVNPSGDHLYTYSVSVPVTSKASVYLPAMDNSINSITIQESGAIIFTGGQYQPGVVGITGAVVENNKVKVSIGSGDYSFDVFA